MGIETGTENGSDVEGDINADWARGLMAAIGCCLDCSAELKAPEGGNGACEQVCTRCARLNAEEAARGAL